MKIAPKRAPMPLHVLALLGITLFSVLYGIYASPAAFRFVLSQMLKAQPHLLLLNWLPVLLTGAAFAFLFRNPCVGGAVAHLLWGILSLANRVKIQVRDDPLYPQDMGLIKEAANSMETYNIRFPWLLIALLLLTFLFFLWLGLRFPPKKARRKRPLLRFGGFLGAGAVLLLSVFTLYASKPLYQSFVCSDFYHISTVYNELGFPYCFCYNATAYALEKPEGYSRSEAKGWNGEETAEPRAADVHVIFVMNEAFSDLTDEPVFRFSSEDDPLRNFHRLSQEKNAVSGHLIVPGFAGGTANTEFDVLTGMQTNMLSETATSAFRCVTGNLGSLFSCFDAAGYATSFTHPGKDWFYNRENVYRRMGAAESLFEDEMDSPVYKGSWVTDDYVADLIEQRFERDTAAGKILFSMNVTIQNHMSYTADKYGDAPVPAVELIPSVSGETQTMAAVYTEGIRDSDAMLGRLTDYFSAQSEPVLLVFWGDHLPYLGDERLGYRELGLSAADGDRSGDPLAQYETPYLIWCNGAAAEALDFENAVAALSLPANGRISANYLGATVLELLGRRDESAWFRYLAEARRLMPVYHEGTGCTGDGTLFGETPDALSETVAKLQKWTYYRMTEHEKEDAR